MLIDTNAYLGPFAFRRLRHNTPDELLRLMDAKGITKAVVSSAAAITYRNAQSANEDLAESVRPHRDRLIPLAVINPFYAGWKDDLKICCEVFGMRGLRLYPKWHHYELTDPCSLELVQLATSTVSEHLMTLKKAGVVTARKEGRWVYYRLAEKGASIAAREATSLLVRLLDASPGAKKDAGRLKGILRIDAEELCKRQKAEGAKCCGRVNVEKVLLQ